MSNSILAYYFSTILVTNSDIQQPSLKKKKKKKVKKKKKKKKSKKKKNQLLHLRMVLFTGYIDLSTAKATPKHMTVHVTWQQMLVRHYDVDKVWACIHTYIHIWAHMNLHTINYLTKYYPNSHTWLMHTHTHTHTHAHKSHFNSPANTRNIHVCIRYAYIANVIILQQEKQHNKHWITYVHFKSYKYKFHVNIHINI